MPENVKYGLVRMSGESWYDAMLRTHRQVAGTGEIPKLAKLYKDAVDEGNSEESAAIDALIELGAAPSLEQAQRTEPEEIVIVTVRGNQAPVEVHPFESLAPWKDIVVKTSTLLKDAGFPVDNVGLYRITEQLIEALDISRLAIKLGNVQEAKQAVQDGTVPFPFWREPDKVWPEYGRPVLIQLKPGVHGGASDGTIMASDGGIGGVTLQGSRTFVAYLSYVEDGLGQRWPHSWRTVCLAFDEGSGRMARTRAADLRIKLTDVLRWSELPPEPRQ